MMRTCRHAWLVAVLVAVGILSVRGGHARAQIIRPFGTGPEFELSGTVQLNLADSTVLVHFQRVKAHLADRKWDEAVETLRKLLEQSEDKLVAVTEDRYVSLREYVHLQLASLPPEALALYRSRVDPMARKWCEEGITRRDRKLLRNVVDQAFASSWGDDALMALGEMALESGDFTSARWYWERIVPADLPADVPRTWPGYPDTNLDLAAVRARLVLTSILEGSHDRARDDLAQLKRLHPDAKGRLGGREVNFADALATMLEQSKAWPQPKPSLYWPTFAGANTRNKVAPKLIDIGPVVWRRPIRSFATADAPAHDRSLLDCHPVLVADPSSEGDPRKDLLLLNNRREIAAIRVASGKAAWGPDKAAHLLALLERDQLLNPEQLKQAKQLAREGNDAEALAVKLVEARLLTREKAGNLLGLYIFRSELEGAAGSAFEPSNTLGAPQFTMTVRGGKLYARMGNGVTSRPPKRSELLQGDYLVCLDLAAQGSIIEDYTPEDGWAFEGSPVAKGGNIYVGMRRSDIRPQAHVACFDAQTDQRLWRRFICGAETPSRGIFYACTRNLLTLEGETLFYNTNLGAVAALSADDGSVRWVSLYPRALRGSVAKLAPHWQRTLNPCVYDRGMLFVAPADSPRIFAFDAATGQMLWQTGEQFGDVSHLLGTAGDCLIAGGKRLYWISRKPGEGGRRKHVWPDGNEKLGYGRGILAGDCVLWPTREKIYVFDAKTARPVKTFDLRPHGVTGGNLLIDRGRLLITNTKEVVLMSARGENKTRQPDNLTMESPRKGGDQK